MSEWKAKRFWKVADVDEAGAGFRVLLDGRPVRTPLKAPLACQRARWPRRSPANGTRRRDEIDPAAMPVTRSANAAIDKVTAQRAEVAAMLAGYGETDLLCHRAEAPEALRDQQNKAWDPVLDWAAARFDAPLNVVSGVLPAAQPEVSLANLSKAVHAYAPFSLTALHDLVTLSGSLVLGLSVAEGETRPETAWELSRIDENWQVSQWGADAEAEKMAAHKRAAFLHAARFLGLCRAGHRFLSALVYRFAQVLCVTARCPSRKPCSKPVSRNTTLDLLPQICPFMHQGQVPLVPVSDKSKVSKAEQAAHRGGPPGRGKDEKIRISRHDCRGRSGCRVRFRADVGRSPGARRTELWCHTGLVGFAAPDADGVWDGFDVAVCRAVAAAVLGDPTAVNFVPTTGQTRFTALASGEIDMLARNTTWTFSRDVDLRFEFVGINYYDGQGFMIPRDYGVSSAMELDGATVCIQTGTTTELNLADFFASNNMSYEPVPIETNAEAQQQYLAGACDVYTTDSSGLAATRATFEDPSAHVILPEIISKEPLGPLVRHGDNEWGDVVRWTLNALIAAEELGVTSDNVAELAEGHQQPGNQPYAWHRGEPWPMLGSMRTGRCARFRRRQLRRAVRGAHR